MTAEAKLWGLASTASTLQPYFGTSPFRWCDRQLTQGYMPTRPGAAAPGGGTTCLRYRRVSTMSNYVMTGPVSLERIRFQLDVLDLTPQTARAAANAVIAFMDTIDLAAPNQFGSPVTSPPQHPNFQANQRSGLEAQASTVVYVETLDYFVWNDTTI